MNSVKIKILCILILFNALMFGQQWTELNTGVSTSLISVSAVEINGEGIVYACGDEGTVIKSTDHGDTWINVSGNGIPADYGMSNIWAINKMTAITAAYDFFRTRVYRTTNGGANWNEVFFQYNGFIDAIWMIDSSHGFMIGDPVEGRWSLWKIYNGGTVFDSSGMYLPQEEEEYGWSNSLWIENNTQPYKIWFGTNDTSIYYSPDSGNTWQSQSTYPLDGVYSIFISTPGVTGNVSYAGGFSLVRSSDGGQNWLPYYVTGTGYFTGIYWRWACRYNSIYVMSSPPSVEYQSQGGLYNHLTAMRNPGETLYLYASKDDGHISRKIYTLIGIKQISNEIPDGFKLYQNYPNPFNPTTSFRLQVTGYRFVKLVIYNSVGQELETLVNDNLQAGVYELEWDGSNYSSGVYYYRLQIIDSKMQIKFDETKKMVMIK